MQRAPGERRRPWRPAGGVHAGELGQWSLAWVGRGWQAGFVSCCVLTGITVFQWSPECSGGSGSR